MNMEREVRTIPATGLKIETRVDPDTGDEVKVLEGHAAVFDSDSEDMGFIEQIAPGAFEDAIKISDVRGLFNHNPDNLLGRTPDTMRLSEDKTGLKFEIDLPDTQVARDVHALVERGDITGNSFAFIVAEDEWNHEVDPPTRRITRVSELFDAGPVTYPAYPETTVSARCLEHIVEARDFRAGLKIEPLTPPVSNEHRQRLMDLELQKF